LKKNWVVLLFLFLFVVLVPGAFAQDTLSDEILAQAKAQADLFLELKNALGLDWLDKYNTYLQNPSVNPEPSWSLSIQDLINNGYLSAGFPSDFSLSPSGAEVVISRQISTQSIRDAVTIYLPSATISGNTVSLLVQRPAQWVAWEDALASKVSRAGDDNPDILPGASLEFGSGSKIEFINNDGKLVGINSLTYKGQELEDRFVNAAGDNMTGPLKINGNIVWHAGNDGSGSGLDADLLEGQHGSFYQNAGNLNAGIVPVARLSGTYNINISGRASIATNADYASNSDKLDGKDSSDFALSGHTHGYVSQKGDTMTGPLRFVDENTKIFEGSNNAVRIQTNSGYVDIGPQNTGWAHFSTDRLEFYFNKPVEAENMLKVYNTGTYLTGTEGKIAGNKILTTADEGHGKGIDADTIDGKHASELGGGKFLRVIKYETPGTYTWTKGSETKYVKVLVWGGGASGGSSRVPGPAGGTSQFGSYVYAYGGSQNIGGSFSGVAGTRGRKGENGQGAGIGGLQVIQYEYENSSYAHGGNSGNSTDYLGGGAGGYATNIIDVTGITSVTVVVGKGGEINSPFQRLWKGNDGAVIVEEYAGPPMGY